MSEKPEWWPECPYPKSVFPMERDDYAEVVPDPHRRCALSGMLGRESWETASEDIWRALEKRIDEKYENIDEIAEELTEELWVKFEFGLSAKELTSITKLALDKYVKRVRQWPEVGRD